ncbi:hypothetical protein HDV00_008046 [Rhizophlyctis rosea]|nr:hypothetical protein HDV00_008046 [Rhizophlyctis rosea]
MASSGQPLPSIQGSNLQPDDLFDNVRYAPQTGPYQTTLQFYLEPRNPSDIATRRLHLRIAGTQIDTDRLATPDPNAVAGIGIKLAGTVPQLDTSMLALSGHTPAIDGIHHYPTYKCELVLEVENYGSLFGGFFYYCDVFDPQVINPLPADVSPLPPRPEDMPNYLMGCSVLGLQQQRLSPDIDEHDVKTIGGILDDDEKDVAPYAPPANSFPFYQSTLYGDTSYDQDSTTPSTASDYYEVYEDDDPHHPGPHTLIHANQWPEEYATHTVMPSTPAMTGSNSSTGSVSSLNQNPGFGAAPELGTDKVKFDKSLDECGDLNRWTANELTHQRRLVELVRERVNGCWKCTFRPIPQEDIAEPATEVIVSCIRWNNPPEGVQSRCFITSVDLIYLLQSLLLKTFTIEEKNRIRRNLENLRPITVSKNKDDMIDFFNLIMSFPNPKPRNIEKDLKVFSWNVVGTALTKIIKKYERAGEGEP